MRFCIPIEFKPEGGGHYFLRSFRRYLVDHGHAVTSDVTQGHEVLFTNHWLVPLHVVLRAIRHNPGVRVVQRIDGAASDYGRAGDADQRQHDVNRVADLTIFQSEYCRWSTREKFPVIAQDGPVIHNPVDLTLFTPQGPREDLAGSIRVVTVSWSTNPAKGAAAVFDVARAHPAIAFYLCGRFNDVPDLPNLHHLGVLDREPLAGVLRSCHVLLTFSRNEACPNHVLEALASGLPVLYGDSGAMAEVIGDGGVAVTPETFDAGLEAVMRDRDASGARSRGRAERCFDPDRAFARYVDVIADAVRRPARMPARVRLAWALTGRLGAWAASRRRWAAPA